MEEGQGDFAENAFGDEVGVSQFDQIPDGDVQRVFAESRQAQLERFLEDVQRILREVKVSRLNRFEDWREHYVWSSYPTDKRYLFKTNEYLWIEEKPFWPETEIRKEMEMRRLIRHVNPEYYCEYLYEVFPKRLLPECFRYR